MPLNASGLKTVIPFSVHFVNYKIAYFESYQNIFNTSEYGRILILSCVCYLNKYFATKTVNLNHY